MDRFKSPRIRWIIGIKILELVEESLKFQKVSGDVVVYSINDGYP
jgi:hypothetical protein